MEEERGQKELFEFEKPRKAAFPRLSGMFPRADFDKGSFSVTLGLDKIIFISMGVIMLMVVIYALGVERGKELGRERPVEGLKGTVPVKAPKALPTEAKVLEAKAIAVVQPQTLKTEKTEPVRDIARPYTIIAVTFIKRQTAEAEADKLKKDGFDSSVIYSDPYFLVCIGAYPDRDSPQTKKELGKVRKVYKDAYLKLR